MTSKRLLVAVLVLWALAGLSAEGGVTRPSFAPLVSLGPGAGVSLVGASAGISYSDDYYALFPEHETFALAQLAAGLNSDETAPLATKYWAATLTGQLNQVIDGDRYHGNTYWSVGIPFTAEARAPEAMAWDHLLSYASTGLNLHTRSHADQFFPTSGWLADVTGLINVGAEEASPLWTLFVAEATAQAWIPLLDRYLVVSPQVHVGSVPLDNGTSLPWFLYPELNQLRGFATTLRELNVAEGRLDLVSEVLRFELPFRGSLGAVGFVAAGLSSRDLVTLLNTPTIVTAGGFLQYKQELQPFGLLVIANLGLATVVRDDTGAQGRPSLYFAIETATASIDL